MGLSADQSDVLDLVGEPRRIDIIRALIEDRRQNPGTGGLSFSDLHDRSGIEDRGQFNYHLKRLRDQFVEHTGDTYRLTASGTVVAGALLAGVYDGEAVEIELDKDCPRCGDTCLVAIEPGQARITSRCGHVPGERRIGVSTPLPPGVATDRSAREVLEVTIRHHHQMTELAANDVCIECYGRMEGQFETIPMAGFEVYIYQCQCDRCGCSRQIPPMVLTLHHPRVVALCHDHGIDVRVAPPWELPFLQPEEAVEIRSADPLRIEVAIRIEDDEIRLTLDRSGEVVDVAEDR